MVLYFSFIRLTSCLLFSAEINVSVWTVCPPHCTTVVQVAILHCFVWKLCGQSNHMMHSSFSTHEDSLMSCEIVNSLFVS